MTLATETTRLEYTSDEDVLDVFIALIRSLERDGISRHEIKQALSGLAQVYSTHGERNRYKKMREGVASIRRQYEV